MTTDLRRQSVGVLAVLLLAACGGGGGGGTVAPPVSPTPPPPGSGTPLALNAANASPAASLGSAFAESVVQLSLAATSAIVALIDAGTGSAVLACSSGTATAVLTDGDGSGTVTAGDTVGVEYARCFEPSLNDEVTGRLRLVVDRISVGADGSLAGRFELSIAAPLSFAAVEGITLSVSGSFDAAVVVTRNTSSIDVSMAPTDSLIVAFSDAQTTTRETARNLSLTRTIASNDTYTVAYGSDIESEIIPGAFSCALDSLSGQLFSFPVSGALECTGAGASRLRLESGGDSTVTLSVDAAGNGNFQVVPPGADQGGTWGDFIEGTLVAGSVGRPRPPVMQPVADVDTRVLQTPIRDVVHDPVADRFYISNATGIVEVDAGTLALGRTLAISGSPGPLAISDDGSVLWVALGDLSRVQVIDTASLTVAATLELGVAVQSGMPRIAAELAAQPGSTDTLVAVMTNGNEIVAYRSGTQLAAVIDVPLAPTRVAFRDAGRLVGIDDSTSSFSAFDIALRADGLTIEKELRSFSRNFNTTLALGPDGAFTSSGRVFDVDAEVIVGRILHDQTGTARFRDGVAVDAQVSRVYFYDDTSRTLDFYGTGTLLLEGVYRLPADGALVRLLPIAGGDVAVATEGQLHIVDGADLSPTATRERCDTIDLGGLFGPDFFIQTNCRFNDAVYDASRDRIYASVPSDAGPSGNAVAVIDPATGIITETLFVGSEPGALSLSATGARLYATLRESNRIAVVDLDEPAVSYVRLDPRAPFGDPQFAGDLAASPLADTDVLVATDVSEVALYAGGVRAPAVSQQPISTTDLFYRPDGRAAYAVSPGRTLYRFDIDAGGVTDTAQVRDALLGGGVRQEGTSLFDRVGKIIDADTAAVIGDCGVVAQALLPDPASDDVRYLQTAFDSQLVTCDPVTQTVGEPVGVPSFGGPLGIARTMLQAGPNRLVIVTSDKLVLLDPGEF